MSVRHKVDPARHLVEVALSGSVDFPLVRRMVEEYTHDPEFDPDYDKLLDLTAVTDFQLSGADVRDISSWPDGFNADTRMAVIAPDDDAFGISRMYELNKQGPRKIRTFRDRLAALRWLGIDTSQPLEPTGS